MSAISPVGAAPALVAAPPSDLHAALAAGTNLGNDSLGSFSFDDHTPTGTGAAGAPTTSGGGPGAIDPVTGGVIGGGPVTIAGQGAANVSQDQLATALQQVLTAVNALITALGGQAAAGGGGTGAGVTGGGGSGSVGQCGMPGCTMDHDAMAGATGAPGGGASDAASAATGSSEFKDSVARLKAATQGGGASGAPAAAPKAKQGAKAAGPSAAAASNTTDKTSQSGLTAASKRGLEVAHQYGLPLVSGKRSGNGDSDHDSGNAIDVGTLPIGAAGSHGATPQMQAYREYMRQQGKAGNLGVKYIISDGRIASATNNWEWRPYTYPGQTASGLAALQKSNPGEYNRLQHFDHVHVSFG